MPIRRSAAVLCCVLGLGCAGELGVTDAQVMGDRLEDATDAPLVADHLEDGSVPTADGPAAMDAGTVDGGAAEDRPTADGPLVDGFGEDRATALDAGLADAPASDAGGVEGSATDRPAVDVPLVDVLAVDVPRDAPAVDVSLVDVPAVDVPRDVPLVDVPAVDVPRDVPAVDVSRDVPVVDASCAGAAPGLTVTAPTSDEVIETCTAAGLPVFYDFTAAVTASSPVLAVTARWITPDGVEAPPPTMLLAAPYVFRRLVGGPSAAIPALSVFGIRGSWRVEFTALDACGRSTTAAQTFSLTFTTRRCPNP